MMLSKRMWRQQQKHSCEKSVVSPACDEKAEICCAAPPPTSMASSSPVQTDVRSIATNNRRRTAAKRILEKYTKQTRHTTAPAPIHNAPLNACPVDWAGGSKTLFWGPETPFLQAAD